MKIRKVFSWLVRFVCRNFLCSTVLMSTLIAVISLYYFADYLLLQVGTTSNEHYGNTAINKNIKLSQSETKKQQQSNNFSKVCIIIIYYYCLLLSLLLSFYFNLMQ